MRAHERLGAARVAAASEQGERAALIGLRAATAGRRHEGRSLRVRSIKLGCGTTGTLATTRAKLMQCWQPSSIGFHWSDQVDLDFILDHLQPSFGPRGAAFKMFDIGFQLADPILGGTQLK
jgi:hypothetical protein